VTIAAALSGGAIGAEKVYRLEYLPAATVAGNCALQNEAGSGPER
jgi:hypothetical protein